MDTSLCDVIISCFCILLPIPFKKTNSDTRMVSINMHTLLLAGFLFILHLLHHLVLFNKASTHASVKRFLPAHILSRVISHSSHWSVTGDSSHWSVTGDSSHWSVTGDSSHWLVTGVSSQWSVMGDSSHLRKKNRLIEKAIECERETDKNR